MEWKKGRSAKISLVKNSIKNSGIETHLLKTKEWHIEWKCIWLSWWKTKERANAHTQSMPLKMRRSSLTQFRAAHTQSHVIKSELKLDLNGTRQQNGVKLEIENWWRCPKANCSMFIVAHSAMNGHICASIRSRIDESSNCVILTFLSQSISSGKSLGFERWISKCSKKNGFLMRILVSCGRCWPSSSCESTFKSDCCFQFPAHTIQSTQIAM